MSSTNPIIDPKKRKWQPREMLMMAEYVAKQGLSNRTVQRVRLGALHPDLAYPGLTDSEKAALRIHARWADAIYYGDREVIIMEAKIRSVVGAISQLKLYKMLFLSDPEYKEHHKKRIILRLIYAIEDPIASRLAREEGIEVVRYEPAWLAEYIGILNPYERQASKTAL